MTKTLRPSQEKLIDGFFENDAQLGIAGMGAGKTAATLHALNEMHETHVINCAIVLAPPMVAATVWPNEPAKWYELNGPVEVRHADTPAQREAALKWLAEDPEGGVLRVAAMSFHIIGWLKDNAHLIPGACALVFDESSFLKSPRSKNGHALRAIVDKFPQRYFLTGTPRPNGYEDLWGQYQALSDSELFKPFDEWRRDNFKPLDHNGYNWEVHGFRAKKLDKKLAPFTTRVDADLDLPALNAGPDFDFTIELNATARAAYDEMEEELVTMVAKKVAGTALPEGVTTQQYIVQALSQAIASAKLSQIAQGYVYDEGEPVVYLHREKEKALTDIVTMNGDEPLLIWYGFRADIPLIKTALGVDFLPQLGGDTSSKDKQRFIAQFGRGELPFLVAHPASAAHGIDDLKHHCRRMVWFCPTWSAEQYDQALKRLHRPGQSRPVFSHQIVARNTVDAVKVNRVAYKLEDQAEWVSLIERVKERL